MKLLLYASAFIFGIIGGYIPALWHQGTFSLASLIGGTIGTFFGIWVAIKLKDYVE